MSDDPPRLIESGSDRVRAALDAGRTELPSDAQIARTKQPDDRMSFMVFLSTRLALEQRAYPSRPRAAKRRSLGKSGSICDRDAPRKVVRCRHRR